MLWRRRIYGTYDGRLVVASGVFILNGELRRPMDMFVGCGPAWYRRNGNENRAGDVVSKTSAAAWLVAKG